MTSNCDLCSGFSGAKSRLLDFMVKKYCPDEMINFRQWEKIDRPNLVDCNLDFHDFFDDIIDKLKDLLPDQFYLQTPVIILAKL